MAEIDDRMGKLDQEISSYEACGDMSAAAALGCVDMLMKSMLYREAESNYASAVPRMVEWSCINEHDDQYPSDRRIREKLLSTRMYKVIIEEHSGICV